MFISFCFYCGRAEIKDTDDICEGEGRFLHLSEDQSKLIDLKVGRSSELIHDACKKHFNEYLSSYSAQQKSCANPFSVYKKPKHTDLRQITKNFKETYPQEKKNISA